MNHHLPETLSDLLAWTWPEIELIYHDLLSTELTEINVRDWLQAWSDLSDRVDEQQMRLKLAAKMNTQDESAQDALGRYLETTFIHAAAMEQQLKEKLTRSGIEPVDFSISLRSLRADVTLFRTQNLALFAEEQERNNTYNRLSAARTVTWMGEEKTLAQLESVLVEETNRRKREQAWRRMQERILQDQDATYRLWRNYFSLRQNIAQNAGCADYRDFIWQQKHRFEYTAEDCKIFHAAIEETVVPAVRRIHERRRIQMGLNELRPWDLDIDPFARPPLAPFKTQDEFILGAARLFDRLDPVLGRYFRQMTENNLLDLVNRANKAPGGSCDMLAMQRRPFIFMNAVGVQLDVRVLLHEAGHAFHIFEAGKWSNRLQRTGIPMEFQETAAITMELLAAPHLEASGWYSSTEAARAYIELLENSLKLTPYRAMVDTFQLWVYENPDAGCDPEKCDEKWIELWDRFLMGVDDTGLEEYRPARWHAQPHIFLSPLYYIEYALAQLGAWQIWGNALMDPAGALQGYRDALALGSTKALPDLFAAAGARFSFDSETLRSYVNLVEKELDKLYLLM